MAAEDHFKQVVIATIAKRAANRCSNPDCRAITSGPTEQQMGSVNVGEAAHIYGANPGSARYDVNMSSAERSAISNAIWLCGNCHKLVDDDEFRYPAGILFEWQRSHERWVADKVGKSGAELRQRYEDRHLEEFGKISYLAERIILEKPDLWEYRLTSEILRYEMAPILHRWDALSRGLYIKSLNKFTESEFMSLVLMKFDELEAIVSAFDLLINVEFGKAWGPPNVRGNDIEIVRNCRLFSELCQYSVEWEESMRFVYVPVIFKEIKDMLFGRAGDILEEVRKIPKFLSDTLSKNDISGTYTLDLKLRFQEDWEKDFGGAIARVKEGWKGEV